MKIKKYTVSQMQEAIQLIKQDLGPEAVIVSSHKIKGQGWLGWFKKIIEVTAVLDDTPLPAVKTLPSPAEKEGCLTKEKLQEELVLVPEAPKPVVKNDTTPEVYQPNYQIKRSQVPINNSNGYVERLKLPETKFQPLLDESILQMAEADLGTKVKVMQEPVKSNNVYQNWLSILRDMDIQAGVAKSLLDASLKDIKGDVSDDIIQLSLVKNITEILKSAHSGGKDARFMTFVGQPGVGKTTTIAKLATKLQLLEKKKVALITIYTYRFGSTDLLKVYADTIDVAVEVVMTPAELHQAIEKHADKDYIIIDTVGRSAKNTSQVLELKSFLEVVPDQHDILLVLNASSKDRDMFRTIKEFRIAHFNKYVFTKTDETETLGSMLNVVSRTGIPIAYYTDGQSVPDDLGKAHPKKLANLLFRSANQYEESEL